MAESQRHARVSLRGERTTGMQGPPRSWAPCPHERVSPVECPSCCAGWYARKEGGHFGTQPERLGVYTRESGSVRPK